jgi:hypothetical protein
VLRDRDFGVGRRRSFVERAIRRIGDGRVVERAAFADRPGLGQIALPHHHALAHSVFARVAQRQRRQPLLQFDERRARAAIARQKAERDHAAAGAEVDHAPVRRRHEVDEQQRIDREAITGARLPQREPAAEDLVARELVVAGHTSSDGTIGLITSPEASLG